VKPATTRQPPRSGDALRAANVRTGLILLSIALVFFGGVLYAHYAGESSMGMSVLGFAIFAFLVLAIGRNLRK
jgi:hypothetical protein